MFLESSHYNDILPIKSYFLIESQYGNKGKLHIHFLCALVKDGTSQIALPH